MKKILALGTLVAGLSVLVPANEAEAADARRSSGFAFSYGSPGHGGVNVQIGRASPHTSVYGYRRAYPGSSSYGRYGLNQHGNYGVNHGYARRSYGNHNGGYGNRYGGHGSRYGSYGSHRSFGGHSTGRRGHR